MALFHGIHADSNYTKLLGHKFSKGGVILRLIINLLDTIVLAMVSIFAFKESKIKGARRQLFLICLVYVTIFDLVDPFYPVENVVFQFFWLVAAAIVGIVLFPYLLRIIKSDIGKRFRR